MSALDVLLSVDAAVSGEAQPRATVRHRHVADEPMVIVAYRLAGEAAAPLGIMFGNRPDHPTLLVAPEPRNRAIRFRDVLNPFAAAVGEWLAGFTAREDVDGDGDPERACCVEAPQLLVPNGGTAEFVGSVLGRSLRYLRSSGEFAVPVDTIALGAHMTWFDQQSQGPGSCVLLPATEVLRRHWATGQSGLEDEDLHVLLAWLDPPPGMLGRDAADRAELDRLDGRIPSAGPTPDPAWDRDVLDPAIGRFNREREGDDSPAAVQRHGDPVRAAVEAALRPTWQAVWRAHRLLRALPEGESVAKRWDDDRWAWTSHLRRVEEERAFFRTTDTPRQAAWMLADRERAQQALDANEALDDPLVLAGLVAAGEALLGTVLEVDAEHREQGPKNMVKRPLVYLGLPEPCPLAVGAKLNWTERPDGLSVELVAAAGTTVTLKVTSGMNGELPVAGRRAAFTGLSRRGFRRPSPPAQTPWTHAGAFTPEPSAEEAE